MLLPVSSTHESGTQIIRDSQCVPGQNPDRLRRKIIGKPKPGKAGVDIRQGWRLGKQR